MASRTGGEQHRERTEDRHEIAGGTHGHPPPEPTGFQGGYVRPLTPVQGLGALEVRFAGLLDGVLIQGALSAFPSE